MAASQLKVWLLGPVIVLGLVHVSSTAQTLEQVLAIALQNQPQIKALEAEHVAQEAAATIAWTPEDPMLGYSELDRGMETEYLVLSQRLRFPYKLALAGRLERAQTDVVQTRLDQVRVQWAARIKGLYYELYSVQKRLELTEANILTVREFARVAEKKYASGQSSQHDAMKAHVELTQLEIRQLRLQEQEKRLQAELKEATAGALDKPLKLAGEQLSTPVLQDSTWKAINAARDLVEAAPQVRVEQARLQAQQVGTTLAQWQWAPDFQLSYQQRIAGEPEDARTFLVSMSVPLWFWKTSAQIQQARAQADRQQALLQAERLKTEARLETLHYEVVSSRRVLQILETSLIPQAQTAYKLSASAYRASRTRFLDFLDSERSYYSVRVQYFEALSEYASDLAQLEALLGQTVATWTNEEKQL